MTDETGMPELHRYLMTYNEFTYNDIKDCWLTAVKFGKAIVKGTEGAEVQAQDFGSWLMSRFKHIKESE